MPDITSNQQTLVGSEAMEQFLREIKAQMPEVASEETCVEAADEISFVPI